MFSNKWEDWDLTRKIINPYGEISILGFPGRGEALPRYNILEPKYFYQKQLTFSYVGRIEGSKEKKIDYLKKSLESIFLKIKKNIIKPKKYIIDRAHKDNIESVYNSLISPNRIPGTYIIKW